MTASTERRDRARTRLQRLSRFEEILRFAALDSDLRALPKGLGISDRRQLAGLLQGDPRVDDSERERLLGDAAVVLHVVRAAHVWDELRRGSVISAFKDLQRVLERAGNTLAQFAPTAPPQPGRRPGRRTVQRANFARYFMATVFEEHETQRKVRDHRKRLSQESRLRPLQESPLFDVTRHAVAANMARRWYSVAGAVTRNLSDEQLVAVGRCPPLPDFCEDMEEVTRRYRGGPERLRALVQPFVTSPVESLREQIAGLLHSVAEARQSYCSSHSSELLSATIRPNEALAFACATLFAKWRGPEKVVTYPESSFADLVRMTSRLTSLDGEERFPKDIAAVIVQGRREGHLALDALGSLQPLCPEMDSACLPARLPERRDFRFTPRPAPSMPAQQRPRRAGGRRRSESA
jgi:hypothetical protein